MLLTPFVSFLAVEDRKAAAVELQAAVKSRDVSKLRRSITQATEVGLEAAVLTEAQETLQIEVPRAEVRTRLRSLTEAPSSTTPNELTEAVVRAQELGLDATDAALADAEKLLRALLAKDLALTEVRRLLEELLPEVERPSPKSGHNGDAGAGGDAAEALPASEDRLRCLQQGKARLAEALRSARQAGVGDQELQEAERCRKRLHNAAEDLKGSIRVFCRVRPMMGGREEGETDVTAAVDTTTLSVANGRTKELFMFDSVFLPGTQEEVFEDCRDLVQSALDGYNVTLFAYGQTGAGKTFTMYGAPGSEGIAPRTIQELYRLIELDRDRYDVVVTASMMELYVNELVDLLEIDGAPPVSGKGSRIGGKPSFRRMSSSGLGAERVKKLNIRSDANSNVFIDNLREERCDTADALRQVLECGNKQRTVAATAMNSESSRSHLLLMIRIMRACRETQELTRSKILMCDLAGAEKIKQSDVSGHLQKEAIEINKSLTALGDVIECLTTRKQHVPYKNHKLTMVMQDALGGSSKTLMFVNCSPASVNLKETMNALKYATRAKKITNCLKAQVQN